MFNEGGFSEPEVNSCTFTANSAECGGAVYNLGIDRVTFKGGLFSSNSASIDGGTLESEFSGLAELTNCVITGSLAPLGGAIDLSDSTLSLVNCTIQGPTATVEAAYLRDTAGSSTVIANSNWSCSHERGPFPGSAMAVQI